MALRLSIIIPALNEARGIASSLTALAPLRAHGHEVIVVDGGSSDDTVKRCADLADAVISSPKGRARQLNAGAARASGEVFLFLHADTRLPENAEACLSKAHQNGVQWGRFDVRIEGSSALFPVISACMNRRSRWTGIATGDQAMFVRRELFEAVGGFPKQPLMEDVELSRRLRSRHWPICFRERVLTSGRRWETHGVWRTIGLMWQLRLRYWLGASPDDLAKAYR
jgi:rSAM/selenodomain-associated transferase 2